MDRRKFIQTGVAGVAGLSLAHTGLANIRMAVPSDISGETGKDRIESLSHCNGNRDERLELSVQPDPTRAG